MSSFYRLVFGCEESLFLFMLKRSIMSIIYIYYRPHDFETKLLFTAR